MGRLLRNILGLLRSFAEPGLVEQVHQRKTITGKTVEARYWVRPEWNDAQKAVHLANVTNGPTKLTHEALARHNPTYTSELDVSRGTAPHTPVRIGATDLLEMLGESGDAGWKTQGHLDRHWQAHGDEGDWGRYYEEIHSSNTNMLNFLKKTSGNQTLNEALDMVNKQRHAPRPRPSDAAALRNYHKEAYAHLPFEATLHHHLFHAARLYHGNPAVRTHLQDLLNNNEAPTAYLQAPASQPNTIGFSVHIPHGVQTGPQPLTTRPHNGVLVSTAVGIHDDAPEGEARALRLTAPHTITAYSLRANKHPHQIPGRPVEVVKD